MLLLMPRPMLLLLPLLAATAAATAAAATAAAATAAATAATAATATAAAASHVIGQSVQIYEETLRCTLSPLSVSSCPSSRH